MEYYEIYKDVKSVIATFSGLFGHKPKVSSRKSAKNIKPVSLRANRSSPTSLVNQDDTVRGKICFNTSISTTSGYANLEVSDGNIGSSSLNALGKLFRFYRFNRITLRIPAYAWTSITALSASYIASGGGLAAAPTFLQVESEHMVTTSKYTTVTAELVLPGSHLNAQHNWFTTTNDATEPNADIMGFILFLSASSVAEEIIFQMTVEYEFCDMIDNTSIGEFFAAAAAEKKKHSGPCSHSCQHKTLM